MRILKISCTYIVLLVIVFSISINSLPAQSADLPTEIEENPFLGYWDLTTPDGQAGWLSVTLKEGHPLGFAPATGPGAPVNTYYYLDSELLWAGSHVNPTAWTGMDGDSLVLYRTRNLSRFGENRQRIQTQTSIEKFTFRINGDKLNGTIESPADNATTVTRAEFTGVRSPELPPAPDLSGIQFGESVVLFSSGNLDGWNLTNQEHTNGWRIEDGMLVNEVVRGGTFVNYGNLISTQDYGDINLTMEVKIPENGNSGIFLRGMYEVQIEDSYNDELTNLSMGALYNRIAPAVKAEKPAGEWQRLDITLVDRHLTVKLNGTTIIDNQPVLGCTTGAFHTDQTLPGPLVIQGENTSVSFRNMVLRPVIK